VGEEGARTTLEPLAVAAVDLPSTLRDHRFQLYQQLMTSAALRGDAATLRKWGHRWLDEIDAIVPGSDDERSALDIARVDAASDLEEPARVIPSLAASEKAMPGDYNASLRLAQMELAAGRVDAALAACGRGLEHVTGPVGREWILEIQANALAGKGDREGARRSLEEAVKAAKEIGDPAQREHKVQMLTKAMASLEAAAKKSRLDGMGLPAYLSGRCAPGVPIAAAFQKSPRAPVRFPVLLFALLLSATSPAGGPPSSFRAASPPARRRSRPPIPGASRDPSASC